MTSPVFDDALFDTALFGGEGVLFDDAVFDAAIFDVGASPPAGVPMLLLIRANVQAGGGYASA